MVKENKTLEGNQNKNPQNQIKVRKSGISFDPEAGLCGITWDRSKKKFMHACL